MELKQTTSKTNKKDKIKLINEASLLNLRSPLNFEVLVKSIKNIHNYAYKRINSSIIRYF